MVPTGNGPPALGRSVVVEAGAEVPEPWEGAPRYRVDEAVLTQPADMVAALHDAWLRRQPVVVELAVDPARLKEPEVETSQPHRLSPGFELSRERLQFLVWTNAYDARQGGQPPVWWHGRRAARLGARPQGPADVVLADGTPAWCDGGPTEPMALDGAALVHRWSIEAGSLAPLGPGTPGKDYGLAPDQLAAVAHAPGPARVIAPAGSGKTRVLTARLRHLLVDRRVEPSTVTAVAFNRKAADGLVERTADLRAGGLHPQVRTIHSLALAICNGLGGGQPRRRRRVIEEHEARRILEALAQARPQANTDVLAPYLEGLAAIRIGLMAPARAEAAWPDAAGLARVFPRYRQILDSDDLLDFDEQVYRAIEVLLTDPDARHGVQAMGRHLLVDEVQDLAPAHLLLLRLVAAPTFDCFGVGDDDQVIYGYAGADPDHLISFGRYFPGAAPYALEVNYRCPPAVVGGATNLLSHNGRRIPKAIRAAPSRSCDADDLAVLAVAGEETAPAVVDQVRTWLAEGAPPAQIAVLARVNAGLLGTQVALTVAGIPTTTPVDARALARTGTRTALAYLRIALTPGRMARADVAETIRRPSRRIARNVADMLTKPPRTSLADVRRLARRLSGGDVAKLQSYADDLDFLSRAVPKGTAAVLAAVRTRIGLGEAMDSLDGSRGEVDRSSHADDLAALEQVAALHPEAATFEAWLRDLLDRRPTRPEDGLVQLSTVHRVKGREWDQVLVIGASADLFPHRLAGDEEEERRVFHVAITRGRRSVVVLADEARPSPFVEELERPAPPGSVVVGPSGGPDLAKGQRGGPQARGQRGRAEAARGQRGRAEAVGTAKAERQPVAAEDQVVVEALRAWRREQAGRDGVPAYVVMSDEHLEGIARRRPATMAELGRCKGMGPIRLERYGDDILLVLSSSTS